MVVIVTGYALFVTSQYDVIFKFVNQRFGEVCWHTMHIQGRRSSGKAGRALKKLRAMETYKKAKKIVTNYVCFCSSRMLTSKIMTEIIENHSEFSGCPSSCSKFISSQSWWTMKLPMILLWKGTSAPVAPLLKGQRSKLSRHASILRRPCAYYSTRTLFTRCRLQCVTV